MPDVLVIGPHPLYRQSVARLVQQCLGGATILELTADRQLTASQRLAAQALIYCGARPSRLEPRAPDPEGQGGHFRVLFSEHFGSHHRTLLENAAVDLILPMAIEWPDAAVYLRRLLREREPGLGLRASADPDLRRRFVPDLSDLTHQERQILRHANLGLSNGAIAQRMAITVNTVKVHLSRIYRKTGAQNRTQATGWFSYSAAIAAAPLQNESHPTARLRE